MQAVPSRGSSVPKRTCIGYSCSTDCRPAELTTYPHAFCMLLSSWLWPSVVAPGPWHRRTKAFLRQTAPHVRGSVILHSIFDNGKPKRKLKMF